MADILSQVDIKPTPETQVPGVNFASVQTKPSLAGAFTETITPTVIKALKKAAKVDPNPVIEPLMLEASKLNFGSLTPEQYATARRNYATQVNLALVHAGVPESMQAGARATAMSLFPDQGEVFRKSDPTSPELHYNAFTGEATVTAINRDAIRATAEAKSIVEAEVFRAKLPTTMTEEQKDSLTQQHVENDWKLSEATMKANTAKAAVDYLAATQEEKKVRYQQETQKYTTDLITPVITDNVDRLREQVSKGLIEPEDAAGQLKMLFNGVFDTEDAITTFSKFGESAANIREKQQDRLIGFAEYFKAYDPKTKLDRAALTQRHIWENYRFGLLNNQGESQKRKLAIADELSKVSMSMEMLKGMRRSDSVDDVTLLQQFNRDPFIRNFADNFAKIADAEIVAGDNPQYGALLDSAGAVLIALDNVANGYVDVNKPQVSVEDVITSARLLLANPNTQTLLPEAATEIKNQIRLIYANFRGNEEVRDLLDDVVDEKMNDPNFFKGIE